MLSYVKSDSIFEGAVTIVLSGNKPSVELLEKKIRDMYLLMEGCQI